MNIFKYKIQNTVMEYLVATLEMVFYCNMTLPNEIACSL